LVGKEAWGDSRGEVDFIAQSKFGHFPLEAVAVKKRSGGFRFLLNEDPVWLPGKVRWRGWGRGGQGGRTDPAEGIAPAFCTEFRTIGGEKRIGA
jgi:hypothetical protein